MRALVVEDETRINADIVAALEHAGFSCDVAFDGEEAWFRGETGQFDIVVLDLGLPKLDGFLVLKRWREAGHDVPVLVLTARGAWSERVDGIEAGADDYLVKPFEMSELLARVRAITRRAAGHGSAILQIGELRLDTRQMELTRTGAPVALSALEYRLMSYLMHHADRVVPPTELIDHIYGDDDARETNALEALITRLRRKLGGGAIETRRGFGYRLCDGGRDDVQPQAEAPGAA